MEWDLKLVELNFKPDYIPYTPEYFLQFYFKSNDPKSEREGYILEHTGQGNLCFFVNDSDILL
jgi:hypothetical protein